MTSTPTPRPPGMILEGDPPVRVRADADLSADAVRRVLSAPGTRELMDRLSITGTDREELLALLPRVLEDEEILAVITERATMLRRGAGLDVEPVDLPGHAEEDNDLQRRIVPGQGLIAILAHVAATDVVHTWHRARGLTPEQSWAALADLGQQMRVHRQVFGEFGLHTTGWTALNWAGRLFSCGRLQFDLSREEPDAGSSGDTADAAGAADTAVAADGPGTVRWVVGTHIPATGPLEPAAVDASFDQATELVTRHFADLGADRGEHEPGIGHEFVCSSWLISDELAVILGPESNLSRFADRWRIESTADGEKDAVFFVFGRRPPYDIATLPRRTRLEAGIAERLADGRGWASGTGRLVR
ncbi:MAG: acyltransferase domain-containing protein [Brachybacterium sp.]|nr:acyltransferase domain-containing protein [Brachybacterium sp.]